jgi:hypothetical protein
MSREERKSRGQNEINPIKKALAQVKRLGKLSERPEYLKSLGTPNL